MRLNVQLVPVSRAPEINMNPICGIDFAPVLYLYEPFYPFRVNFYCSK